MTGSPQITRIVDKLAKARAAWEDSAARAATGGKPDAKDAARFFGAAKHRFTLLPKMPRRELERWERKYAVALPADYRFFLTEIGSGGAGPYYGLVPLQSWEKTFHGDEQAQTAWLHAPCLLRADLPPGENEWAAEVAGPDWEAKFNRDEWEPGHGTLPVVEKGCAGEICLILNGPLRGCLCHLDWLNTPVIHTQLGFLDWYERWLDQVLARAVVLF